MIKQKILNNYFSDVEASIQQINNTLHCSNLAVDSNPSYHMDKLLNGVLLNSDLVTIQVAQLGLKLKVYNAYYSNSPYNFLFKELLQHKRNNSKKEFKTHLNSIKSKSLVKAIIGFYCLVETEGLYTLLAHSSKIDVSDKLTLLEQICGVLHNRSMQAGDRPKIDLFTSHIIVQSHKISKRFNSISDRMYTIGK